jgi:hypothetical protein
MPPNHNERNFDGSCRSFHKPAARFRSDANRGSEPAGCGKPAGHGRDFRSFRFSRTLQQPADARSNACRSIRELATGPRAHARIGVRRQPWVANPSGKNPDGTQFGYNPWYFATPQAAAQVARLLGGKVVASNEFTAPGSPFVQQQPNLMVEMPDGRRINAGLVASFYAHGYPQSYIDSLIAAQINGSNT